MRIQTKWLLAVYAWSGVALILGICNVSYQEYGRYWWAVAVMLLLGLLISVIRNK